MGQWIQHLMFLVYLISSSMNIFGNRMLVPGSSVDQLLLIILWIQILVSLIFLGFLFLKDRKKYEFDLNESMGYIPSSISFCSRCFFSYKLINVCSFSSICIFTNFRIICTSLLSYFLFGESLKLIHNVFFIIIILTVLLYVYQENHMDMITFLLSMSVSIHHSLYIVFARRRDEKKDMNIIVSCFYTFLGAFIIMTLLVIIEISSFSLLLDLNFYHLLYTCGFAVINNIVQTSIVISNTPLVLSCLSSLKYIVLAMIDNEDFSKLKLILLAIILFVNLYFVVTTPSSQNEHSSSSFQPLIDSK